MSYKLICEKIKNVLLWKHIKLLISAARKYELLIEAPNNVKGKDVTPGTQSQSGLCS